MKERLSHRRAARVPLLLSFLLPFCIAYLAFFIGGLYPIGDKQLLAHDEWHQYYPFLVSFRDKLLHGGSLQYTWDVGMGTSYLSLFAYYLSSPLYLLSVLIPLDYLREYFAFLTVLKIGLAGLFMGYFLRSVYRKNTLLLPFFALMYAFCAWCSGYYWNIIWLDTFALLPLLMAGTVSLLRSGRFRLYVLSLALTLWCSYYIAYFCCVFVLLSFIGFCICRWNGLENFLRRFVRIAIATAIGVGLCAVLLIPTLMAMRGTYSSSGSDFELLALNIAKNANGKIAEDSSLWELLKTQTLSGVLQAAREVLANLLPYNEVTKMDGLPNVFCSFTAVILSIFYFCNGKIRLREKIFNLLLLLFLLLSFIFRALDYFWHGFHFPNMLPYRFSFLFSFVLICMAYRAVLHMDHFRLWKLAVIVPLAAAMIVNVVFMLPERSILVPIFGGVVLVCAVAFFLLYAPEPQRKTIACCLLCLIITCEMVLCFSRGEDAIGFTTRSSYPKEGENVQSLLRYAESQENDLFWRAEVDSTQTLNDGALNGYHGVTVFNSSANVSFNRFSRSLGLSSWPASNRYSYSESSPFTNLMCGIRYLIDRTGAQRNTSYTTLLASSGETKLLKNTAYVALGFMADSALADFVAEDEKYNPIWEQEDMFRLATGLDAPLYTHLKHADLTAPEGATLYASGTSGTQYSYTGGKADGKTTFSVSYAVETDGLYCATTKVSGCNEVKVYYNDRLLFTRSIKARSLFSLGNFSAGDTITLTYEISDKEVGTISADVALQNDDVFDAGYLRLSDEPWELTEFSDTHLRGMISAKEDGLFYTSIPYEDGWAAYVDGREVTLAETYDPQSKSIALTDAVIAFPLSAGTHIIELRYSAPGLSLGIGITILSLLVFAALCIALRKRPVLLPDQSSHKGDEPPFEPDEGNPLSF